VSRLPKPDDWSDDIAKLDEFFAGIPRPTQPINLTAWEKIENVPLFIESHLATVKRNNGNRTFLPSLNRLQALRQLLTGVLSVDCQRFKK